MTAFLGITGTGTGVGKTALAAASLLWCHQKGYRTAYCKPVQCGLSLLPDGFTEGGDAEWIGQKLGMPLPHSTLATLVRLKRPASPHLAAESQGLRIARATLEQGLHDLASRHDAVVVEGAGGAAVPFSREGWGLAHLKLPIHWVVAAAPGLGTLHQTLTTVAWLREHGARVAGFVFVSVSPEASDLQEDNRLTLEALLDLPCLGHLPYLESWTGRGPLRSGERRLWVQALQAGYMRAFKSRLAPPVPR